MRHVIAMIGSIRIGDLFESGQPPGKTAVVFPVADESGSSDRSFVETALMPAARKLVAELPVVVREHVKFFHNKHNGEPLAELESLRPEDL